MSCGNILLYGSLSKFQLFCTIIHSKSGMTGSNDADSLDIYFNH